MLDGSHIFFKATQSEDEGVPLIELRSKMRVTPQFSTQLKDCLCHQQCLLKVQLIFSKNLFKFFHFLNFMIYVYFSVTLLFCKFRENYLNCILFLCFCNFFSLFYIQLQISVCLIVAYSELEGELFLAYKSAKIFHLLDSGEKGHLVKY